MATGGPDKSRVLSAGGGYSDIDSFNELYICYAPRVKAFVFALLKDREEARDITHDIFMKIWNRRNDLRNISDLSAYIFRMAKNAVLDFFEHSMVDARYRDMVSDSSEILSADLSDLISAEELAILIQMAIEKMPPRRKEIFIMHRFKGLTYKEISERLGISPKTVENQISAALADLRKVMALVALIVFH